MSKLDMIIEVRPTEYSSPADLLAVIEAEESGDGHCPFTAECNERRRRLPTYRQYQECHWAAWRNVADCPIYRKRNGDNDK